MNRAVFVDSWAWIAMLDDRDPHHQMALRQYEVLREADTPLMTTNLVVYEAYEHLRQVHGLHKAEEYMQEVAVASLSVLRTVYVSEQEETEALAVARKYDDQDFSMVDCMSFALMRRHGLQTAFSGDKHFIIAGFNTIPAIKR